MAVICINCGAENSGLKKNCFNCGEPLVFTGDETIEEKKTNGRLNLFVTVFLGLLSVYLLFNNGSGFFLAFVFFLASFNQLKISPNKKRVAEYILAPLATLAMIYVFAKAGTSWSNIGIAVITLLVLSFAIHFAYKRFIVKIENKKFRVLTAVLLNLTYAALIIFLVSLIYEK